MFSAVPNVNSKDMRVPKTDDLRETYLRSPSARLKTLGSLHLVASSTVAHEISGQRSPSARCSTSHVVSRAFRCSSCLFSPGSADPEMKYIPPARGESKRRPSLPVGSSVADVPQIAHLALSSMLYCSPPNYLEFHHSNARSLVATCFPASVQRAWTLHTTAPPPHNSSFLTPVAQPALQWHQTLLFAVPEGHNYFPLRRSVSLSTDHG